MDVVADLRRGVRGNRVAVAARGADACHERSDALHIPRYPGDRGRGGRRSDWYRPCGIHELSGSTCRGKNADGAVVRVSVARRSHHRFSASLLAHRATSSRCFTATTPSLGGSAPYGSSRSRRSSSMDFSLSRRPSKSVPNASPFPRIAASMALALLIGIGFYCLITLAAASAKPWQTLLDRPMVTAAAFADLLPHRALSVLVLTAAALSVVRLWNGMTIWIVRLLQAQARAGFLPAWLDVTHARLRITLGGRPVRRSVHRRGRSARPGRDHPDGGYGFALPRGQPRGRLHRGAALAGPHRGARAHRTRPQEAPPRFSMRLPARAAWHYSPSSIRCCAGPERYRSNGSLPACG